MFETDFCYRRDSFGYNFNYNCGRNINYYDVYLVRKAWCEKNADRLKEYYKIYYENNKEKLMLYNRKQYYFNYHPEEYHSKWELPPKKELRIQKPRCYYLRERKIRIKIFNKFNIEVMNRKEMIDAIIKMKPDEYKKSSFGKMKVADVLSIYKSLVKDDKEPPESFEGTIEGTDDDEEQENKVCCAGKEPDCKKCIRAYIFNEEWDKLFNKFNIYFTKITEYKIDDEMEQAIPKDGCWTNYSSNNLSLYGNFNKKKYENADEEAFRKEMLMKYNYKYYEPF